jgi:hypothetical protein
MGPFLSAAAGSQWKILWDLAPGVGPLKKPHLNLNLVELERERSWHRAWLSFHPFKNP